MVTKEELKGQWNQVKGRLQEHWGQLTDDDLRRAEGSADRLVGVVQQKTGATRREVEDFLQDIFCDTNQIKERVTEAARQYAETASEYAAEAGDYVKQNYRLASDKGAQYGEKLAHTVRSRPTESLAIAFGLGIAAGALFFLKNRR
ncbi:MAG: CsbD family protein [Planctomycetales bacterium]|nr:CsbD family protein [Planctomycetales bacterium]